MVAVVEQTAANRINDYALQLLDACREAAKDGPDYVPGDPNIVATLSLAVQGLVQADHWPGSKDGSPVKVPPDFTRRLLGVADGLGVSIGGIVSLDMRLAVYTICARAVGESMAIRGTTK